MHEFIKSVEPVKNWNKSEKNIVKGYASFTAAYLPNRVHQSSVGLLDKDQANFTELLQLAQV